MGRGQFGQFRGLSRNNFLESRYYSVCLIFGAFLLGESISTYLHITHHRLYITQNTLQIQEPNKCKIVLTILIVWWVPVYHQQSISKQAFLYFSYISRYTPSLVLYVSQIGEVLCLKFYFIYWRKNPLVWFTRIQPDGQIHNKSPEGSITQNGIKTEQTSIFHYHKILPKIKHSFNKL